MQGMPMASPTMMPTRMPMAAPTMMPTMMPGMQGGMQGGMTPVQMTTSNKDMMSTMQGMGDLSKAMSVMKAMGMDKMMTSGKQYTLLVPNDMAMNKIGMDKINMIMKDKPMAMNMMKGFMMDGMVKPSDMTDGKMLTMMNGQQMKVSMMDGKMTIDGATITKAVQTTNGMVYVIDNMPSWMMNMMQMGAGQMGSAPMTR
jgi:uncharacterized surface protein with fasciclin (FAS1) repeats